MAKMRKKQVSKLTEFKEAWRFNLSIWTSQAIAAIAYVFALFALWSYHLFPEAPLLSDFFEFLSTDLIKVSEGFRLPAIVRMMHTFYEDIPEEEAIAPSTSL